MGVDLVGVSKTTHARHDAENVVVGGIHTNLGRVRAADRRVRQDELKGGIVNAREVAGARRLVLLRPKRERVHVDAAVRGAGVGLERLDQVEVAALTLREAVLAVQLKLGSHDRVVAPAVEVERGLGKHEGARIRHGRARDVRAVRELGATPARHVKGTRHLEEARRVNEAEVGALTITAARDGARAAKRVDGVRERVNRVRVVERLGTEHVEQTLGVVKRRAVIDVGVRLDHPDELLDGVVEVELNLVRRGTDRLIARELELLDEVLVRVLGHAAALVSVKEHVVDEERSSHQRLVVGSSHLGPTHHVRHRPEALVNRAKVDVDAHLVVLEGNEREGKARVLAEPELERDVQGRLRERIARSAHLLGGRRLARAIHHRERGVGHVRELGGVANHRVVALGVASRHGELVPDVHPVAVVAVNALAANLHLDLGDELLTREVKPAGIDITAGVLELLANLREGDLEHGAVRKVAIARDGAGHAPTKVGLAVEGLLNRLKSKVGVAPVSDLPVSNLRITSKVNILSAVSYKLHQTSSHSILFLKKKIICIF